MIIREAFIDEEDFMSEFSDVGVYAMSIVDYPANEKSFIAYHQDLQYRNVNVGDGYIIDLNEFWKYTAEPDPQIIETSHEFCKYKAGNVHHISEIRGWDKYKNRDFNNKPSGFIDDSTFFANFNGINSVSFNIDNQIFNCRHHFRKVMRLSDIPEYKQKMYRKKVVDGVDLSSDKNTYMKFSVEKDKQEIVGPALIPNQMIYRSDINGEGPGYIWMSKDTIKKIKERFGYNRSFTIQHQADITGKATLLKSWLHPDTKETLDFNVPDGSWILRYKILDKQLWDVIKQKKVVGYSIEGFFKLKP